MTFKDKLLHIAAEFMVLYCIVLAVGYNFYFAGHMDTFEDMLVIAAYMILAVPFSAIAVTVGPNLFMYGLRDSLLFGFGSPWRPIAATRHLLSRYSEQPDPRQARRCEAEIDFGGLGGPSAATLVDRLARQLQQTGISRSNTGGLIVFDNDTRWGVEPDPLEPRLTVWIDHTDKKFQDQVFEGVRSFVDAELGVAQP